MPKPSITVYGKPACVQCNATTNWLAQKKAPFTYVDISKDSKALAKVQALGYASAPVVMFTSLSGVTVHWYGFNPGELDNAIAAFAA